MNGTHKHRIIKYRDGGFQSVEDLLAVESRLSISVNGQEVMNLYCTPLMIRELSVGLIMTEGIAEGLCSERMSIMYGEDGVRVEAHAEGKVRTEGGTVTSGCVGGMTFDKKPSSTVKSDPFSTGAADLTGIFSRFQKRSDMYNTTGCIHSAALSDGDDIIVFAEDIGRHNAVDKVIGYSLLEGMDFSGKIMMASGRLSSEIAGKCARWGVPILVSRAAPTSLAVKMAEESGITMVGFLRGKRFNVYTHTQRITP
jgi:FdhD protein